MSAFDREWVIHHNRLADAYGRGKVPIEEMGTAGLMAILADKITTRNGWNTFRRVMKVVRMRGLPADRFIARTMNDIRTAHGKETLARYYRGAKR
jgi:hypothetical protein